METTRTLEHTPTPSEGLGGEPIGQYMTPSPVTVDQEATLSSAVDLMNEHNVRHLPVLAERRLVGLLSERDLTLIETLLPSEWQSISVAEAMSIQPYAVTLDTPVGEVAAQMAKERYGSAVVLDANSSVVGIFTTVDALQVLAAVCNP